jgi:hypothetical protein
MDIFDSEWLIDMLEKSSKTPQGRLLSLFDILDDWLKAPRINLGINLGNIYTDTIVDTSIVDIKSSSLLLAFCTKQAVACGAEHPSMLAEHIVLIARNAVQQSINQPNSSLMHAQKVANALILAQTQKKWSIPVFAISSLIPAKTFMYGVAASLLVGLITATVLLPELIRNSRPSISVVKNSRNENSRTVIVSTTNNSLTAQDAASMYTKYEQMRNGTCQFPEVLQIPDKDKAIYIENVVGGKLPSNLADLAIATAYLEKVRCNFTPMLMAHST